MKEGIQIEMVVNKDNRLEVPRYLEDIPDYDKKLRAWEYVQLPEDDRIAKTALLRGEFGIHAENPVARCFAINKKLGFERAIPNESSIHYQRPDELKVYYKDILDEQGNLLPSKFAEQKAA